MTNIVSVIDHLVIVAATLEQGVAHIEKTLGVKLVKGGEHIRMGTHNCVLRLGESVYLEVIAINPAAGPMSRPRWFGMDDPWQKRKAEAGPYLATFVARTNDINACAAALPEIGTVHDMQRGTLHWRISIREDGALVHNGTVPIFIQWPPGGHPVPTMPDSGCALLDLEIRHPQPPRLEEIWRHGGLRTDDRLSIGPVAADASPALVARISTPHGIAILS
jgi:hypothetical protein